MGVKIDNHQGVKNAIGIISSIFDSDVGRPLITSFKLKDTIESLSFDNKEFSNFDVNTEFGGIGLDINHETTSIKYKM